MNPGLGVPPFMQPMTASGGFVPLQGMMPRTVRFKLSLFYSSYLMRGQLKYYCEVFLALSRIFSSDELL